MRFASLGSGSKGNATLVETKNTCLMIDCGFSVKDVTRRLECLGKTPQDLHAILVTHEHSDHWKGVIPLAKRFAIDVFITPGCLRAVGLDASSYSGIKVIQSDRCFDIGDIRVQPATVPHDAREPVQFLFFDDKLKLGILTDLGTVPPYIRNLYSDCDGLIVEANHDIDLLAKGDYPSFLKDRVAGPWGHLNNDQTASLVADLDQERVQHIVIAHISQANNDLDRVKNSIESVYSGTGNIYYATQDEGFDWLEIST
ncbi:MAG: MBL fold metallo-hydrolase [Porticoccaceae bacterium]